MSALVKMTYAQAACLALQEAMRADPIVVALGEDLGRGGDGTRWIGSVGP